MAYAFVLKIAIVIASLLAVAAANYYLKDDNVVEEVAELVIEKELEVDNLDLTPESPE